MNAHQTMALAHVNRPAPTRLGHSVVDAHLVMLCKVMVTIAAVSEHELYMVIKLFTLETPLHVC